MADRTIFVEVDLDDRGATVKLRDLDKAADRLDSTFKSGHPTLDGTSTRLGAVAGMAAGVTTRLVDMAVHVGRGLFGLAQDAAMAGSRLEQLQGVTVLLGRRAGYSATEINAQAEAMQKTGITGRESYETLTQLIRYNLGLENATKLQAAAQNSASIAGRNSSEVLGMLVHGITTLQPEVLRTAGFTITLEQAMAEYTRTTGKSSATLSAQAKQQMMLNAVLKQAEGMQGVYAESMNYSAKQMQSLDRIIEQAKEQIGKEFGPVLKQVTADLTHMAEYLRDHPELWRNAAAAVGEFIAKAEQIGSAVVGWVKDLYDWWTKLPEPIRDAAVMVGKVTAAVWALNAALGVLGLSAALRWLTAGAVVGGVSLVTGGAAAAGYTSMLPGIMGAATVGGGAAGVGTAAGAGTAAGGVGLFPLLASAGVLATGQRLMAGSWEGAAAAFGGDPALAWLYQMTGLTPEQIAAGGRRAGNIDLPTPVGEVWGTGYIQPETPPPPDTERMKKQTAVRKAMADLVDEWQYERDRMGRGLDLMVKEHGSAFAKITEDAGRFQVVEIKGFQLARATAQEYLTHKEVRDAIGFGMNGAEQPGQKGYEQHLADWEKAFGERLTMEADYRNKVATMSLTGKDLELANIDIQEKAEILKNKTLSADRTAYYQHQRDLANETASTLEERLARQGVVTKRVMDEQTAVVVRDYKQMLASGKYTAEQIREAFEKSYAAQHKAFLATSSEWQGVLSGLASSFQQMAQIAGGSLGSSYKQAGLTFAAMNQVGAAGTSVNKILAGMSDGSVSSAKGMGQLATQITSVAMAMDQATQSTSHWQNAMSGAATGAYAGWSMSGGNPYGALAGGVAGLIYGYYKKTPGDDVTQAQKQVFLDQYGGYDQLKKSIDAAGISQAQLNYLLSLGVDDLERFKQAADQLSGSLKAYQTGIDALVAAGKATKVMADALSVISASLGGPGGTEVQFQRLGLYTASVFGKMLKDTGSLAEAFAAVADTLDALLASRALHGDWQMGGAMGQLLNLYQITKDNPDLYQRLTGLGQFGQYMGAAGLKGTLLTTFGQDLADIYGQFQTRPGVTQDQTLLMMQAPLQQLWEATYGKKGARGVTLDPAVQAMLDAAVGKGLVGADMRSMTAQQLDVLVDIRDILAGTGPGGGTGGGGGTAGPGGRQYGNEWWSQNAPGDPNGANAQMPQFAGGTDGYEYFGTGTPALLHGWEKVTPMPKTRPSRRDGGGGGGVPQTLVVQGEVEGEPLMRFVVHNFRQYLADHGVRGVTS